MEMTITIEVDSYHKPHSQIRDQADETLHSLGASEFPTGIMIKPDLLSRNQSWFGTVEDFVEAIKIKKEFLASEKINTEIMNDETKEQTIRDKANMQITRDREKMFAELKPIREKSKAKQALLTDKN